jgi:hypothetical protein
MGGGASIAPSAVSTLTPQLLANEVCGLGKAYEGFWPLIIDNAINDSLVTSMMKGELDELFSDLSVRNKTHRRVIIVHFKSVIATGRSLEPQ